MATSIERSATDVAARGDTNGEIGAVAAGDLSKKITADTHGEMLELKLPEAADLPMLAITASVTPAEAGA